MSSQGEAARAAWARLLGLRALTTLQVVVAEDSPLCRRGWIGILGLDGTVTASVPREDLLAPVEAALVGLTAEDTVRPEAIVGRLPPTASVLGPAALFYSPPGYAPGEPTGDNGISDEELQTLFDAVPPDEVDESGTQEITSPVFASRTTGGEVAAVCGYRRWPNDVAHLCVLTSPAHRRNGHGRRAATTAIRHTLDAGLLPQWRARPPASQALARRLGFVKLGSQLSLEPA